MPISPLPVRGPLHAAVAIVLANPITAVPTRGGTARRKSLP